MHPMEPRAVDIRARFERAKADFSNLCKAGLKFDMTRGKPSSAQLDLSSAMLTLPGNGDFYQAMAAIRATTTAACRASPKRERSSPA
jgi:hypothetical protein